MPILALSATVALLVTVAAGPPRPPSPEEQKAFAEGLRLYETGDARGAERAWKAGYAAGHDPAFLVRIGEAEEKAGAPQEATQTYQQYLHESPDAADRGDVEARLQRLLPDVQRKPAIEVEAPGDMTNSAKPAQAAAPASPRMLPTPGQPASSAAPGRVPAVAATQANDDANASPDDPRPLFGQNAHRSRLNSTAWVGVGVTTLLLGVATFFGASASDKASDANRLLTFRNPDTGMPQEYATLATQYEEDLRVGRRDDRMAKGFLIAAGATAAASAVLFVLDGGTKNHDLDDDRNDDKRAAAAHAPARRRSTQHPQPEIAWVSSSGPRLGLSWGF